MKIRINENQFDRVLQKYLDVLLKRYSGKICRMEVDGYDEDNNFWIMIVVSEKWRDEEYKGDDIFYTDVVKLKRELKQELTSIFSGINFQVGSYVGDC
jgi:hypothetical protein